MGNRTIDLEANTASELHPAQSLKWWLDVNAIVIHATLAIKLVAATLAIFTKREKFKRCPRYTCTKRMQWHGWHFD